MSRSSVDQLVIKSPLLVHSSELEHSKKAVHSACLGLPIPLIKEGYIFPFFFFCFIHSPAFYECCLFSVYYSLAYMKTNCVSSVLGRSTEAAALLWALWGSKLHLIQIFYFQDLTQNQAQTNCSMNIYWVKLS